MHIWMRTAMVAVAVLTAGASSSCVRDRQDPHPLSRLQKTSVEVERCSRILRQRMDGIAHPVENDVSAMEVAAMILNALPAPEKEAITTLAQAKPRLADDQLLGRYDLLLGESELCGSGSRGSEGYIFLDELNSELRRQGIDTQEMFGNRATPSDTQLGLLLALLDAHMEEVGKDPPPVR